MKFPSKTINSRYINPKHHCPSCRTSQSGLSVIGWRCARYCAYWGIKVLQDAKVPVDCVVGTSMGAIVGGAMATGMSPQKWNKRY